jgi:hypothetical protein
MSRVKLIMFSAFDLSTFLPIARQALGHGVSSKADTEALSDELRNMLCIAGLIEGNVTDVEDFYSLSYLIAADERDMPIIIQIASMPHIVSDSVVRGLQVAVVAGPLSGWLKAVQKGCSDNVAPEIRKVYNIIYKDLDSRSLCGTLKVRTRSQDDSTFLLEYKKS